MKANVWDRLGMEPWEWQVHYYVKERGIDPHLARTFVILWWTWHGDFRPLSEAIKQDKKIDDAVLPLLVEMIDEGRLTLRPKRKGRPRNPEQRIRNFLGATMYEKFKSDGDSEKVFEAIAGAICASPKSVRETVTRLRKQNKRQKA
jgi:hypothetical protein